MGFAPGGGVGQTPSGTRKADGAHPTGMLSCFQLCLFLQYKNKTLP